MLVKESHVVYQWPLELAPSPPVGALVHVRLVATRAEWTLSTLCRSDAWNWQTIHALRVALLSHTNVEVSALRRTPRYTKTILSIAGMPELRSLVLWTSMAVIGCRIFSYLRAIFQLQESSALSLLMSKPARSCIQRLCRVVLQWLNSNI